MQYIKLSNLINSLESGSRPKGGVTETGIPSLGGEHLNDEGSFKLDKVKYIPEMYFEKLKKGIIQKEDILIVKDGATTGKVAFVDDTFPFEKAAINEHLFRLSINSEKALSKYVYYYLRSKRGNNELMKDFRGATIGGITRNFVDFVTVPVPKNKKIQYQIVKVLDKIQEVIRNRQAQITALDELTQSVFLEMFGDPKANPKNFKYRKLIELCLKITDGTHHSPPMVENGIPYISAKHLGKGYLDFYSNPAYVSKEDHEKIYKRCDPIKGDVLYIKDGATTGIAGINHYEFEFSMLSSLALIRTNSEKLNNYYLVHYLNNERVKEEAIGNMSGGAIKRLTINKINNFLIMVPPIELQLEFASKIIEIEKKKELLKSSLDNFINLYNSLLQNAFNGSLFQD